MARNVFISIGGFLGGDIVGQSISGMRGVDGSGGACEEKRKLAAFDRLQSSLPGNIDVLKGDRWGVVVRADDNIVPLIRTEVSGAVLKISAAGSFSTRTPIRLTLTVAGDFPDADILGSGDLTFLGVDQKHLAVNLQGSGDAYLSGAVEKLDLKVMGSGDVHAERLLSKDLKVSLMGSGDIDAHAGESVDIALMGSGDVRVSGSPSKVRSSALGSGDVTVR